MKNCFWLLILPVMLTACNGNSKNYENGDLNATFTSTYVPVDSTSVCLAEDTPIKEVATPIPDGWSKNDMSNGIMPECYNFNPTYDFQMDNYLSISVGDNTDVAVKLIDESTNQCIRFVYINSSSTYSILNIPEGRYYLKIAYGRDWISTVENNQCIGRFNRNNLYERGADVLDYRIVKDMDGYSVPSYSIKLNVESTFASNSFSTQGISEAAFNQ